MTQVLLLLLIFALININIGLSTTNVRIVAETVWNHQDPVKVLYGTSNPNSNQRRMKKIYVRRPIVIDESEFSGEIHLPTPYAPLYLPTIDTTNTIATNEDEKVELVTDKPHLDNNDPDNRSNYGRSNQRDSSDDYTEDCSLQVTLSKTLCLLGLIRMWWFL